MENSASMQHYDFTLTISHYLSNRIIVYSTLEVIIEALSSIPMHTIMDGTVECFTEMRLPWRQRQ